MERLDRQTQAYYDALPSAAVEEDYAWGLPGERALAAEAQFEEETRADIPDPESTGARPAKEKPKK